MGVSSTVALSLAGSFTSAVASAAGMADDSALALAGVTDFENPVTLVLAAACRWIGGGGPEEVMATAGDVVRESRSGCTAIEENWKCAPWMREIGMAGGSASVSVLGTMVEESTGAGPSDAEAEGVVVGTNAFVSSVVAGGRGEVTGVFSLLSYLFGSGGGINDRFEGL